MCDIQQDAKATIVINTSQATPMTRDLVAKHTTNDDDVSILVGCAFNGDYGTIERNEKKGMDVSDMKDIVESSDVVVTGYYPKVTYAGLAEKVANSDIPDWISKFIPNLPKDYETCGMFETQKFVQYALVLHTIFNDETCHQAKAVCEAIFDGIATACDLDVSFKTLVNSCMEDHEFNTNNNSTTCDATYMNITSKVSHATQKYGLLEILAVIESNLNNNFDTDCSYVQHSNHGLKGLAANLMKNDVSTIDVKHMSIHRYSVERIVQCMFNFIVSFYVPPLCLLDNQTTFRIIAELTISMHETGDIESGLDRLKCTGVVDLEELVDRVKDYDPSILSTKYRIVHISDCEGDDLITSYALSKCIDDLKVVCQLADNYVRVTHRNNKYSVYINKYYKLFTKLDELNIEYVYNNDLMNGENQVIAFDYFSNVSFIVKI